EATLKLAISQRNAESTFSIPELNIDILSTGKLIHKVGLDSIAYLKIDQGSNIQDVYFYRNESDLIILAWLDEGVVSYSTIQCLSLDSNRIKWNLTLEGSDFPKQLIKGNYIYVGCSGDFR